MTRVIFTILLIISVSFISCTKHLHALNSELTSAAKNAREPGLQSFVTYRNNKDTIKGISVKWKTNRLNGKVKWTMDKKEIPSERIATVQNEYAYRMSDIIGFYIRLVRGKMNMYVWQREEMNVVKAYDPDAKVYVTHSLNAPTQFYIGLGSTIEHVTLNVLKTRMSDCPIALQQIDKEFAATRWNKNPDEKIYDYQALIRLVNVYNECK